VLAERMVVNAVQIRSFCVLTYEPVDNQVGRRRIGLPVTTDGSVSGASGVGSTGCCGREPSARTTNGCPAACGGVDLAAGLTAIGFSNIEVRDRPG
jgi:hypothetical protein